MQINYTYDELRRGNAGFWNVPNIENTAQDMNVPPIYAPYRLLGYWPDRASPADSFIAPNSARHITVANAMGSLVVDSPILNPDGTPACIGNYGPGCPAPPAFVPTPPTIPSAPPALTPQNLVAPMPSIVAPKNPTPPPAVTCEVQSWVSQHTGLAILAAVAVFAIARGGGGK